VESQAKVRSTIQRHFNTWKPLGRIFSQSRMASLRHPDASQAAPRVLDDLYLPAEGFLDPLNKATLVVRTVRPDQLESRKAALERFQEVFATRMILDVGLVDEDVQDQPICIDEQMPLATFDFFAPIVAAKPPF